MKVIISQKALLDALTATSSVVSARTPKPILQCVYMQAGEGSVRLCTTDQEVGVRFAVPEVEVQAGGEAVVPADKILHIVRESSDETLALERSGDILHIKGHDSHFQIFSQDSADFPPVAEFDGEPQFEIENGVLRRLIERTLYAAAKENTRYAINGVLWEKQGKQLRLVATDGRRLAMAVGPIGGEKGENASVIVSTKVMSVLSRVAVNPEEMLGVRITGNQVLFRTARSTISAALVEGHFPKYEDVIPKDADRKLRCAAEDLLSAVRRSALLTNEESKGIRLSLRPGTLLLSSRAPQEGEAQITMTVSYEGPELDIGFNPNFLLDALRVVEAGEIELAFKESNRPGIFRTDSDFLYVVMPVSLS